MQQFATLSFIVTGILLIVVGGMSVGIWFGRKPISGSCGGLANNSGEGSACDLCSNRDKCPERNASQATSAARSDEQATH